MLVVSLGTVFTVGASAAGGAEPPASPEITAAMQPYLDSWKLAGVVSVIADRTGKVWYKNLLGYADVETKKPVSEDNVFWIASMTKMFAGASIMMLADEGKATLDDPVTKFIPQLEKWMVVEERDASHVLLKSAGPARHRASCPEPHQRPDRQRRAAAGDRVRQHAIESSRAQFSHWSAPMAAGRQVSIRQSGDEHRRPHRGDR